MKKIALIAAMVAALTPLAACGQPVYVQRPAYPAPVVVVHPYVHPYVAAPVVIVHRPYGYGGYGYGYRGGYGSRMVVRRTYRRY